MSKVEGKTILIVEDEDINFQVLKEMLSRLNAKVLFAKNGQEAIDLCRNNAQIDMILMDIKMPVMDGYDATRIIKGFRPDIPILAQTAYATETDTRKILESGFNDKITKPINKEILRDIINKHL